MARFKYLDVKLVLFKPEAPTLHYLEPSRLRDTVRHLFLPPDLQDQNCQSLWSNPKVHLNPKVGELQSHQFCIFSNCQDWFGQHCCCGYHGWHQYWSHQWCQWQDRNEHLFKQCQIRIYQSWRILQNCFWNSCQQKWDWSDFETIWM